MNDLQLFYSAYWQWVMAGAPDGMPFNRGHELTGCITDWAYAKGTSIGGLHAAHRDLLVADGLDPVNPFNDGMRQPTFTVESKTKRCYLNGARLNFVHKHRGNK